MGINIDGARDLVSAADGSMTIEGFSIHSTGIGTFTGGIQVGTAATISSNGNATLSGILTATAYHGDGSGLTGIAGTEITNSDFAVGFSTFFVDYENQRVGIGTNVPARQFDVYSPTSGVNLITLRTGAGAYGQAGIAFASNSTASREKASIFFQERTGGAHHAGDLCFSVDNASGDAGTAGLAEERLRIQGAGHVGIGTSMPTDRVASSNSRILNVGIVTANTVYAAAFIPSVGQLSNRNLVINGAMRVAQRGDTTGVQDGYGGCDRFKFVGNSAARATLARTTGTTLNGFGSCQLVNCTTADSSLAAGDYHYLGYRFEGQHIQQLKKGTANAESVTLSFWVSSPKTGTHIIQLYDNDNARHISKSYTVSSADTWEKKTLTFVGDTSGALDNNSDYSLQIYWWLLAGSNYQTGTLQSSSWDSFTAANAAVGQVNCLDSTSNNFKLTGVQLEVGSTATPFEHRRYGDELIRCQRYFNMIGDGLYFGTGKALTDAFMWSANELDFIYTFPVEMRTTPSLYQVTGADYFKIMGGGVADSYIDGNFTIQYGSKRGTSQYSASDASRNAGASCHVTVQNSAARYGYNAEL